MDKNKLIGIKNKIIINTYVGWPMYKKQYLLIFDTLSVTCTFNFCVIFPYKCN